MKNLGLVLMIYSQISFAVDVNCVKKEQGRCVTFDELFWTQQKNTFSQLPNRIVKFLSASGNVVVNPTPTPQQVKPQGYISFSSTMSNDYSSKKRFKPRKECDNPDLPWNDFVKCTNERMDAKRFRNRQLVSSHE